ncbi:MAG: hypothetical protein QW279_05250 [Candidatus Jordarchaeaceae archaeon]
MRSKIIFNKVPRLTGVLFFIFLLVYVWPFWTGDVIRSNGATIPSARVSIPKDYLDAASWLNSLAEDFNVLSIPLIKNGALSSYVWNNGTFGYFGAEPSLKIFPKPLLIYAADSNGLALTAVNMLSNNESTVANLLSLLNVRYVLFHNDYNPILTQAYSVTPNPLGILEVLNSSNNFILEKRFGDLLFFRNKLWIPCQLKASLQSFGFVGDAVALSNLVKNNPLLQRSIVLTSTSLDPAWFSQLKSLPKYPAIYFTQKSGNFNENLRFYVPEKGEYSIEIAPDRIQNLDDDFASLDNKPLSAFTTSFVKINNDAVLFKSLKLDAGFHDLAFNVTKVNMTVLNGWLNPFDWSSMTSNFEARSYYGNDFRWKPVVRTDGGPGSDTISFASPASAPYQIPSFSNQVWQVFNSSLIYISGNHNHPIYIDALLMNGKPLSIYFDNYINNYNLMAWWETSFVGLMGIDKKPAFPLVIPPREKAIIAIYSTEIPVNFTVISRSAFSEYALIIPSEINIPNPEQINSVQFVYSKINPTEYSVQINSSQPFYLSLTQLYDTNWKLYVNGKEIAYQNHYVGFGFSNVWLIDEIGYLNISIQFDPQKLFIAGALLSFSTVLILIAMGFARMFAVRRKRF